MFKLTALAFFGLMATFGFQRRVCLAAWLMGPALLVGMGSVLTSPMQTNGIAEYMDGIAIVGALILAVTMLGFIAFAAGWGTGIIKARLGTAASSGKANK